MFRTAAWFALAAGLLEAGLLTAHGRLIHGFIYLSPHLVWMAPVTNLLWFGILAAILALAGRRVRRCREPAVVIGACASLAALSILLIPSQLHRLAALILALGLGYQTGRWAARRPAPVRRLMRWSLPAMAALVPLLALGTIGWGRLREARAMAGLEPGRGPNVLLIVLDTVRRASLSLYGYGRETSPALTRWAKRGVVFDHAFATASWTLPSHAGMFTGRLPHEVSAGWLRPLDDRWPTLAEALQARGYHTAGFVANILYCNRSFGLGRGFQHYEDYQVVPGEFLLNNSIGRALSESHLLRRLTGRHDILARKAGSRVSDAFLSWQAGQQGRPWFAFLNYFDAHQPYFPPDEGQFGPAAPRDFSLLELRPHMGKIADAESTLSPAEVEAERNVYDAALRYLDGEVDRVLTTLESRGVLDNTIVVITSDHGEQFMEHGLFDHGNSLYRFATEVPLVILGPGVPAGGTVAAPVSLRDLPVTTLDLARQPADPRFPGRTLTALWSGDTTSVPVIMGTSGPAPTRWFKSVVWEGQHAIWSADSVLLFDLDDPAELRNLAGAPEGNATVAQLAEVYRQQTGSRP